MSLNRVFVYGTLKKGGSNHRYFLSNSKFVDKAQIHGTMYHLGGFPAITTRGDNNIHGEIYEVDDNTFSNLDRLEGYPRMYDRTKVETSKGAAWVYTMDHQAQYLEQQHIIQSGVWPIKPQEDEEIAEEILEAIGKE